MEKAMLYYDVADTQYVEMLLMCLWQCVLQATDGFLFVAQCENGCIIYVSDSVTPVLSFSQVCMRRCYSSHVSKMTTLQFVTSVPSAVTRLLQ